MGHCLPPRRGGVEGGLKAAELHVVLAICCVPVLCSQVRAAVHELPRWLQVASLSRRLDARTPDAAPAPAPAQQAEVSPELQVRPVGSH